MSATTEATGCVVATIHRRGRRHSTGYTVQIFKDGEVVEDYSAGANPHDSQAPGVSSIGTVARWARSTAKEMYRERYGKKPKDVTVEYDNGQG